MNKKEQIERINNKYAELTSKYWNDTKNYNIEQFFNEVLPRLQKEKKEEIDRITNNK